MWFAKVSLKQCVQIKFIQGRLVDLYCDEIKQHKLDDLRAEMEEESVAYLREKAETLK